MCLIVAGDEIDHGDIALLAVAMAASDPLFDTLRIPGQVVVDDRLAKLKIQPFCASLRAYKDLRARTKLMHQRKANANFAARFRPRSVLSEADGEKQAPQVFLCRDRLGKHNGLTAALATPP